MNKRIAVGVGNTSVQFAQFDTIAPNSIPVPDWHHSVPVDSTLSKIELPDAPASNCRWVVASVNQEAAQQVERWAKSNWQPASYESLARTDFPITINIRQPDRVGRDRIAAAVAVNQVRTPDRSILFVDAGTAITVNAINAEGHFVGGAILPGTLIASRALNTWTEQLPCVSVDWRRETSSPEPIGNSTEAALESGIYWSAIGAVRELVQHMSHKMGDNPPLFITGGFGQHLAQHIKEAQHVPHLVVAGIALSCE